MFQVSTSNRKNNSTSHDNSWNEWQEGGGEQKTLIPEDAQWDNGPVRRSRGIIERTNFDAECSFTCGVKLALMTR